PELLLLLAELAVDILHGDLDRFPYVLTLKYHAVPSVLNVPRREVTAQHDRHFAEPLPLLVDGRDVLNGPRHVLQGLDVGGVPACLDAEERPELTPVPLLDLGAGPPLDKLPSLFVLLLALGLLVYDRYVGRAARGTVNRAVRLPDARNRPHLPPTRQLRRRRIEQDVRVVVRHADRHLTGAHPVVEVGLDRHAVLGKQAGPQLEGLSRLGRVEGREVTVVGIVASAMLEQDRRKPARCRRIVEV